MSGDKAASLSVVKIGRGTRGNEASGKGGDITAQLETPMALLPPPAQPAEPLCTVVPPTTPPTLLLPDEPDHPEPPKPARASPGERPDYWQFIDYWNRLRRDRPLPALTLLDRELVADSWPDTLMVTYATIDTPIPQIARISRSSGEIEYSPMITDWIISCARQVARHGEAMEDEQEYPSAGGATNYRLLLLPFAGAQGESDHVLCHLSRAAKTRPAIL